MINRLSVKFCLSSALLTCLWACGLGAASVTISMEGSKGACKEIALADWPPPPNLPDPGDWPALLKDAPLTSDLDFRSVDGGVLVGLIALPSYPNRGPRLYSPAKYRIDLATGRVGGATENEWAGAQPYSTLRDSVAQGSNMKPEDRLVYKGKEFVRRGSQWPLMSIDTARLSPDGSFLGVDSWDGEMRICPEIPAGLGCRDHLQGSYYVEIYDAGPATLALSLRGQFQGIDPEDLFRRSAWASKDFYVLPLDAVKMSRFALCDVRRATARQ
jgi:hypothetical protein